MTTYGKLPTIKVLQDERQGWAIVYVADVRVFHGTVAEASEVVESITTVTVADVPETFVSATRGRGVAFGNWADARDLMAQR